MALVKAKCTSCGGILEIDNGKDAAICPFCGTPYVVEKAINNYITNNQFNIGNAEFNIVGQNADARVNDAELLLHKLNDFDRAKAKYKEVVEKHPGDFRGYWGLVKIGMLQFPYGEEVYENYKKAFALADKPERLKMAEIWDKYTRSIDEIDALRKREEEERKNAETIMDSIGKTITISVFFIIFAFSFIVSLINLNSYNGTGLGYVTVLFGIIVAGLLIWLICSVASNRKARQNQETHLSNAEDIKNKINTIIDEFKASLSFPEM